MFEPQKKDNQELLEYQQEMNLYKKKLQELIANQQRTQKQNELISIIKERISFFEDLIAFYGTDKNKNDI